MFGFVCLCIYTDPVWEVGVMSVLVCGWVKGLIVDVWACDRVSTCLFPCIYTSFYVAFYARVRNHASLRLQDSILRTNINLDPLNITRISPVPLPLRLIYSSRQEPVSLAD